MKIRIAKKRIKKRMREMANVAAESILQYSGKTKTPLEVLVEEMQKQGVIKKSSVHNFRTVDSRHVFNGVDPYRVTFQDYLKAHPMPKAETPSETIVVSIGECKFIRTPGKIKAELRMFARQRYHDYLMMFGEKEETDRFFRIREERGAWRRGSLKLAKILVGKTEQIAYINKETMEAYRHDRMNPTYEQIKSFTFIRWATSFDI